MERKFSQEEFIKRLEDFAIRCKSLVDSLSKTASNLVYGGQLIRSSSSPYANYLEATCALTRKDFTNDVNKSRKEAKESHGWLRLISRTNSSLIQKRMENLLVEADEIVRILSSSVKTAKLGQKQKL